MTAAQGIGVIKERAFGLLLMLAFLVLIVGLFRIFKGIINPAILLAISAVLSVCFLILYFYWLIRRSKHKI